MPAEHRGQLAELFQPGPSPSVQRGEGPGMSRLDRTGPTGAVAGEHVLV
jgi:hypothetical protein